MAWKNVSSEGEFADNEMKQSKFHSGMLLPLTLNRLWQDAQNHCRAGLFHKWNADLDMLWTILASDVEPQSQEEKDYEEFCRKLEETGDLRPPAPRGFDKIPEGTYGTKAKQFKILLAKHIWLGRLQNKQGKGTSYFDETEDDFD